MRLGPTQRREISLCSRCPRIPLTRVRIEPSNIRVQDRRKPYPARVRYETHRRRTVDLVCCRDVPHHQAFQRNHIAQRQQRTVLPEKQLGPRCIRHQLAGPQRQSPRTLPRIVRAPHPPSGNSHQRIKRRPHHRKHVLRRIETWLFQPLIPELCTGVPGTVSGAHPSSSQGCGAKPGKRKKRVFAIRFLHGPPL